MDSLLMFIITLILWSYLGSSQTWKIRNSIPLQGEKNEEYENLNSTEYESVEIIDEKEFIDSKETEYESYEYESVETILNSLSENDETHSMKKTEPTKLTDMFMYFTADLYQKMQQFVVQIMETIQDMKDKIEEVEIKAKGVHYGHYVSDGNDRILPIQEDKGHRLTPVRSNRGRKNGEKRCVGNKGQTRCCTEDHRCGRGEGDCDYDHQCEYPLVCGHNNCRDFTSTATNGSDCCKDKMNKPFGETEGDCDEHQDCKGDLVCRKDSCVDVHQERMKRSPKSYQKWNPILKFDCCSRPKCTVKKSKKTRCVRYVSEGSSCGRYKKCKGTLVCKNKKCRESRPEICKGLKGQAYCCSRKYPCKLGGGNCYWHEDCQKGLVCGNKNCRDYDKDADKRFDCCEAPYGGLNIIF